MTYSIILCTINDFPRAKEISRILLEKKLIACSNIIPKVTSMYSWQNEICEDEEYLMLFKTKSEHFEQVKTQITTLHPYDVPEIISVSINNGSEAYLSWIKEVVL